MAKQNWPTVDRADTGTRPVPPLDSVAVVDYEEIPDRILNNLSAGDDRTFVHGHRLPSLDSLRLATKTARLQNILCYRKCNKEKFIISNNRTEKDM